MKNVYKLQTNDRGQIRLRKFPQEKSNLEFRAWCDKLKHKLWLDGIDLEGEVFTIAYVKSLIGVEQQKDTIQKVYHPSPMLTPISILMRKRQKGHY